jgi:chlorite dismutase
LAGTENSQSTPHIQKPQEQQQQHQPPAPIYLNFTFLKVDPKWRWLNEIGKEEAAKEFASLIEIANTKMKVRTYSTVGLREDSDLMVWMISDSLEKTQILASKIYTTVFGKYVVPSYVFLSMSRPSVYSSRVMPGFMTDEQPLKYAIVYPFVKSREWYLLPFDERKKMMEEHIAVGRKFPNVRLNTTYSFGIDDQDFMLAFETESLSSFQDLIMQLRETQVSRHIVRDTPMIVCVHKKPEDILKSLG